MLYVEDNLSFYWLKVCRGVSFSDAWASEDAMFKRALFAAILACSACATAPAPDGGVADTSFVESDGSRTILLSAWIPALPGEVYRAVATVEGWKSWAAPAAFGEVSLSGGLETSYSADAKAGDPANIKQQFLALSPERLVVFRTVQTPPGFPHAELYKQTVSSFHLAAEGAGTRLTFTHQGFGSGAAWDELYGFFAQGDKQTLEALQKLFAE